MEPVLEVRHVWKSFGDAHVLRDVSFAVPRGALATLTGRSGSGKSTLFRLLAGLDHATRGEILVEGTSLEALDDERMSELRLRRIGLVFQSFNLLPDLSVAENVRLPLDIAGEPRNEAAARVRELLALVDLNGSADRLPNVLSAGESQRAAIARALANDPAILLADEPTGNLDGANARNVLDVFARANRELGATVLIITHDPLAVERVPHRLALREGAVSWESEPSADSLPKLAREPAA